MNALSIAILFGLELIALNLSVWWYCSQRG